MTEQPEHQRAYDRALTLLAARGYATADLRRRLTRSGFAAADIEAVVGRLTAAGLLDDAAYARQLTRSKLLDGGAASRRVRRELAARGVGRPVADAAIAEVMADEAVDESHMAEQLACRRAITLARFDRATQRRRLYAYLARRGYDADDIRRAVKAALGD
ncbi:MAG: regulatory protein RecX [Gemmatimonadales bacterium]|jgi:regulatory protein